MDRKDVIEDMQTLSSLIARTLALELTYFEKRTPVGDKDRDEVITFFSTEISGLVETHDEIPKVVTSGKKLNLWLERLEKPIEYARTIAKQSIEAESRDLGERYEETALFNNAVLDLTQRYEALYKKCSEFDRGSR